MIGSPIQRQNPYCCSMPPVGDLLLDDVAQIQHVATGEFPQPVDGVRINRSVQGGREQLGDFVERQRLDVEPVELAVLPYLVDLGGDLFAVTKGEYHFGGAALDDLVQDERRQFVQQMHIVDAEDDRPAGAAVTDSITSRTSCSRSLPVDVAHGANAPSGTLRADVVPTAQRDSHPRDEAADTASRAIRLFPTPAAPHTRIPGRSGAERAASMVRFSSRRPVSGHVNRTGKA